MPDYVATQDASGIQTAAGGGVTSDWNGTGYCLPVGTSYITSGTVAQYRFRAGINFTQFLSSAYTTISSAELQLKYYNNGPDGGNLLYVGDGGSRTLQVYLAGKAVVNAGSSSGFGTGGGYTSYSSSYTYETHFETSTFIYGTPVTKTITTTTDGAAVNVDVTDLLSYAVANGIVFKGFVLKMSSEGTNRAACAQFYSVDSSGTAPKLVFTANANTAPNAPINLSPTSGSKITSQNFTGDFSDPDTSDTISSAYVEISTSNVFTTPIWSSGWVAQSGSSFSVSGSASLTYGTTYYWRAKTKDALGVEGPFSAGTDTFGINTKPSTPSGLTPSGITVDSLTPTFSGSSTDSDPGDYIASAKIVVSRSSDNVTMWDSGYFSSGVASFTKTYGSIGTKYFDLSPGTSYYWKATVKDSNGTASSTSSATTFTTAAAGVTGMTPSTSNGTTGWVKTLTPSFNFVTPVNMNQYTFYLYDASGNQVYTVGPTAVSTAATTLASAYVLSGYTLTWGTKYQWAVTYRDVAGVTQPISSKSVFWTNSAPVSGNTSPVNNSAITTTNPSIVIAFNDQDLSGNGFADAPTNVYAEVRRASDSVLMYTMSKSTSATITGVTAAAGVVTYTCSGGHSFSTGDIVTITGVTSTAAGVFNLINQTVLATGLTSTVFKVTNAATGTYTSGGTATSPILNSVSNTLIQGGAGVATTVTTAAVATVTGVSAAGGVVTYTCSAGHPFWAGQVVTMTGITSTAAGVFNLASQTVLSTGLTDTVFKVTNAATGTYTSGGTATSVGTSSTAKNVQFRYKTRYTDSSGAANAQGALSTDVYFKPTTGPTIALINDASYTDSILNTDITAAKLNNPVPSFSYTFTGAFGKTQSTRRLRIIDTSASNTLIYDSGYSYTSLTTFDAPEGYISNNATYQFLIDVQDTDGVASNTISETILALWSSPAQLGNLVVEEIDGSLRLSWDASVDATFVRYNIYRRTLGGTAWELVDTISEKTTTSYLDYSAGVGVTYQYTVIQTALPAGSHAVDADIDVSPIVEASNSSDNWWIIVDGNESLAVELYVDSESRTQPYQEETFEPFGRDRKVVVRYAQYGIEGDLSCLIPSDEVSVKVKKLKEISSLTIPVYLKTAFGDVYKVYLGVPSYSYTNGGHVNYAVNYVEVD
jgi:hypothetical protein